MGFSAHSIAGCLKRPLTDDRRILLVGSASEEGYLTPSEKMNPALSPLGSSPSIKCSTNDNLPRNRPASITIGSDSGPKSSSAGPGTLFNIHKSMPDHRVRGKHLRLPSPLQI